MKSNFKDITGQVFSRLTVLKYAGTNNTYGSAQWTVRCVCGKEKVVGGKELRSGRTRSCGCMKGDWNREHKPRYKGECYLTTDGYVWNGATKCYEHVRVMREHLGRLLMKGETVHHKNGVRNDNRFDNLELWASSHPSGQRVEDLVAWSKELLARYEPTALSV
jgi:hypothetical protein